MQMGGKEAKILGIKWRGRGTGRGGDENGRDERPGEEEPSFPSIPAKFA